jgi:hypothetical protein
LWYFFRCANIWNSCARWAQNSKSAVKRHQFLVAFCSMLLSFATPTPPVYRLTRSVARGAFDCECSSIEFPTPHGFGVGQYAHHLRSISSPWLTSPPYTTKRPPKQQGSSRSHLCHHLEDMEQIVRSFRSFRFVQSDQHLPSLVGWVVSGGHHF